MRWEGIWATLQRKTFEKELISKILHNQTYNQIFMMYKVNMWYNILINVFTNMYV